MTGRWLPANSHLPRTKSSHPSSIAPMSLQFTPEFVSRYFLIACPHLWKNSTDGLTQLSFTSEVLLC